MAVPRVSYAKTDDGAGDVDHLMVYDAFAHLPIYGLEDLSFVSRGEAGAFIAAGNTAPGGRLPMNTRQLRGTAPAQVADVEVSVTHGVGGMFAAAATLVLTDREP